MQFNAASVIIAPAMLLERLQLKNYKMFRHVDLRDIPALAVFAGVNGSGKTTLFDAFDFLQDILTRSEPKGGIEPALNWGGRGGIREMRTRGQKTPIEIEMTFRAKLAGAALPVTYLTRIGEDNGGNGRIEREILHYPLKGGRAKIKALDFKMGRGKYISNEASALKGGKPIMKTGALDPSIPAAVGIGQFGDYESVGALRSFVGNWLFSRFNSDLAREPVQTAKSNGHKHLSMFGGNLAGYVDFIKTKHPKKFRDMLKKMSRRAPGFNDALVEKMTDGHLRLKFRDARWKKPFDARHMSDGTLKMLGFLALLEDPEPRSLLCVEEPENQLYPYLLDELMEDFRLYAQRGSGQVLASTHSYELMDAAKLEEVFWLVKRPDGTSALHRAGNNEIIRAMSQEEGVKMGELWRRGHLEGARP